MQLEALPAKKGDCLLLHHGSAADPKLILIDGGPGGVYTKTLRPRLLALRDERIAQGLLGDDQPLRIDLVVVSHIDDDHINGIKALLQDIKDGDVPFRVDRIWHNGFESLVDANAGQVAAIPAAVTASLGGAVPDDFSGDQADTAMILASVKQGREAILLAKALHIAINPEFGGKTIVATDGQPLTIDDLKVTVIGPLQPELDALRADFAQWLEEHQGAAGPASFLASFSDDSVANLASIVLLVEGGGKKLLLTGDARGDRMMEAVDTLGLLDAGKKLAVDVLKVPHHGSNRNVEREFFAMFPAERYIFSGNGEHGNPERETLAFVAEAAGGRAIVAELTYDPAEIDTGRAADWAKRHATVAFDQATMGVAPFLEAQPNFEVRRSGQAG